MTNSKSASNPSKETISRYEIISELGSGGMGVVYKAVDPYLKKTFAVKVVNALAVSDDTRIRFQKEAKALKDLKHPAIPEVYNFSITEDDEPYMVMEFVEGQSLFEVLSGGELPSIEDSIKLMVEVCEALGYAHEHGIIHRDLKPGNLILVDDESSEYSINVIDFGLAKLNQESSTQQDQDMTKTGVVIGSPPYMSPEQIQSEAIGPQSDIYSLGCVFYELLTGEKPFLEKTALATITKHVSSKAPKLKDKNKDRDFSEELEKIVEKCLAKNKQTRFKSMAELKEHLQGLLNPNQAFDQSDDDDTISNTNAYSLEENEKPSNVKVFALPLLCIILAGFFITFFALRESPEDRETKDYQLTRNNFPEEQGITLKNAKPVEDFVEDRFNKISFRLSPDGKKLFAKPQFNDSTIVKLVRRKFKVYDWDLSRSGLSWRGLAALREQPVKSINLSNTNVGARGLNMVAQYKNLKYLYVMNCDYIKNEDLVILKKIGLKSLLITSNNVTPEATKIIKSMHSLDRLDIGNFIVPPESIADIAELPKLKKFGIRNASLTNDSARAIAEQLNVHTLRFVYCKVKPSWIRELSKTKTIERIVFDFSELPEGVLFYMKEIKPLKRITLKKVTYSKDDLAYLRKSRSKLIIEEKNE